MRILDGLSRRSQHRIAIIIGVAAGVAGLCLLVPQATIAVGVFVSAVGVGVALLDHMTKDRR